MDLAVAVIIGTAFGKIVSSLVDNVVMPVIGILLGGVNFSGLTFTFGSTIFKYGVFVQSIIDFVIIAFVIFLAIKALHRIKHASVEEKKDETPVVPEEVKLLTEIRDLLRKN